MKILYVDLETQWRGGQSQALLTVRGLIARGHELALVAARSGELARRAQESGIGVMTVSAHRRRWHASRAIRRLFAETCADIVHTNEPHALTAAWLGQAHRKSKLVFSRRVAYPIGRGWIGRRRYLAADRIFAISKFVAESVAASGISRDRITLVPEGVEIPVPITDAQRFEARERFRLRAGDFVFGSVGYLLPEKGHAHLLRAFAETARGNPQYKLLLAGDGPERRRLETLAVGLAVRDRVIFAGMVEKISEVYAATDVFVFPSLAEPLGTSMLTAMAYGLPVIGIATGGVPEYVDAGVSGLLAKEASAPAIAAEMARMAQNAELRQRLGAHAREHIRDNFSADKMVENTIQAYENVLH
ncbi:MAG TPA: glycosyltransferase family 4 protein [Candidatus Acidoferrales bacterium]|nr:glycosyltransferase family 4 protein [Candidatus Acidoferrales bacterium]